MRRILLSFVFWSWSCQLVFSYYKKYTIERTNGDVFYKFVPAAKLSCIKCLNHNAICYGERHNFGCCSRCKCKNNGTVMAMDIAKGLGNCIERYEDCSLFLQQHHLPDPVPLISQTTLRLGKILGVLVDKNYGAITSTNCKVAKKFYWQAGKWMELSHTVKDFDINKHTHKTNLLNISGKHFDSYHGNIIKLEIKCDGIDSCLLFKVEGIRVYESNLTHTTSKIPTTQPHIKKTENVAVIVSVAIVILILVLVVAVLLYICLWRKRRSKDGNEVQVIFRDKDVSTVTRDAGPFRPKKRQNGEKCDKTKKNNMNDIQEYQDLAVFQEAAYQSLCGTGKPLLPKSNECTSPGLRVNNTKRVNEYLSPQSNSEYIHASDVNRHYASASEPAILQINSNYNTGYEANEPVYRVLQASDEPPMSTGYLEVLE